MKTIIDASSAIFGGYKANPNKFVNGYPVGGLLKFFGIINASMTHQIAVCFDGSRIIKKELLPEYKAGRIPNYAVYSQIELAKEIMDACGMPYYVHDRYEADDYIYSLCTGFSCVGSTDEVFIYTDDHDLACCVASNISIRNITSNGICIDKSNFSERADSKKELLFNTISLWKTFHGDSSDHYSGIKLPDMDFDGFARWWSELITQYVESGQIIELAYSNYELLESILNQDGGSLSRSSIDTILRNARIAFPYIIDVASRPYEEHLREVQRTGVSYEAEEKTFKLFNMDNIKLRKFKTYCDVLGVNNFKRSRGLDLQSETALRFKELLSLRAKELSNGEFIADKVSGKPIEKTSNLQIRSMDL